MAAQKTMTQQLAGASGMPQLALGVQLRPEATFGQYQGNHNLAAVTRLRHFCASDPSSSVYLTGPEGAGRSHLLQALCLEAEAGGQMALCLSMAELMKMTPQVLDDLGQWHLICLDDIHLLAGNQPWEQALFSFFNWAADTRTRLCFSAGNVPASAGFHLPDLTSRLSASLLIRLQLPEDEDLNRILQQRARALGLDMQDEVARYLLLRAPRAVGHLLALLDQLDEVSLQAQRRLTVPFVKQVLGW